MDKLDDGRAGASLRAIAALRLAVELQAIIDILAIPL
jgi:hypothetical protein